MQLSEQTEAVLLLTGHLGDKTTQPLTPNQWADFAAWLWTLKKHPADLLTGDRSVLNQWQHKSVSRDRLEELLNRGSALALACEKWNRAGLWILSKADVTYPQLWRQRLRKNAPPIIYGVGPQHLLAAASLAVVGSRKPAADDLQFAHELGGYATQHQLAIVSGGATGCDEESMLGALDAGGSCIGICADTLLRRATSKLWRQGLRDERCVLVSACGPEARFNVGNAMGRNKLIYASAQAAMVVHSGQSGGTWTGAQEALKAQWLPLWVRPHQDPEAGNNALIEQGGKPLPNNLAQLSRETLTHWAPSTATCDSQTSIFDQSQQHIKGKAAAVTAAVITPAPASVESSPLSSTDDKHLFATIAAIIEQARGQVRQSVNYTMVVAYWQVGRVLVEVEQGGEKRAAYGTAQLQGLAEQLTAAYGKGFDERNLRNMRQFFLGFQPIRNAARSELGATPASPASNEQTQQDAARLTSETSSAMPTLRPELSWSHYRRLMRVDNDQARAWYLREAAEQHWSERQLGRQIASLYYERLLSSHDQTPVRQEADQKLSALAPSHAVRDYLRDPYVLDFLNLSEQSHFREAELEQALIDQLQRFLMELGKGFAFVARQKRLRLDDDDFYLDLVFYNYLLKCFVLIDLKVGKLTHQDLGQMDTYVRMFEASQRSPDDNPTIGVILCSEKNEALVQYSVLKDSEHLFASRYMTVLPSEQELRAELERERDVAEERLTDTSKL